MEVHVKLLSNCCRICGKKKVLRAKQVEPFKEVLLYAYNINIDLDNAQIHPSKLCMKCYMKLYHIQKQKNKNDCAPMSSYQFQQHNDKQCYLCKSKLFGIHTFSNPLKFTDIKKAADCYNMKCFNNKFVSFYMKDYVLLYKTITQIENDLWTLHIFDKQISNENEVISHLPKFLNPSSAAEIFSFIENVKICSGNNNIPNLIKSKIVNLTSKQSQLILKKDFGIIETKFMSSWNDFSIIRSSRCSFLINSNDSKAKCENCITDIKSLIEYESPSTKSTDTKKCNNKYLKKYQLLIKVKELQRNKKIVASRTSRLKKKVRDYLKKEGVAVDFQTNELLLDTMKNEPAIPFKKDSPQFLLWKQQIVQSSLKNSRAMVWHPLIIKWCLSIYLKSPGTYKHIRSSPFLFLPCKNTLLKYVNFTDPGCGFNVDILRRLIELLKPDDMKDYEKNVSLIFDEMKIKSGLMFCKTTGKMVGFTDMGPVNDTLNEFHRRFDRRITERNSELNLAQYVIVFMARGIFSSLCYYFGHFASEGFKSDQIYSCAWNAIMILESIGLKVRAIVSDGATANRKFYNLHKMEDSSNISEGVVYWTLNHCAPERKIFFICDVPHLLKTTRNNLENSHWNKKSRNLMYKEQELGWHQIISLYEWDVGFLRDAPGLRMGHKLRDEHINLTPQSRMRVNLAVQVLSSTVVHMLEEQNDVKTVSLRKFISFMDKFFDCMNVSKFINKTRKDALNPYISAEDPRFKWLSKDFLGFLSEWEKESNSIPNLSKEEQSRLCLSKQTLEGLRISVHSFVELGKILLLEDGVKFLLSEKFTQDPVEEYFSKQRRRGGCNENPTLEEFNRNVLGLNVAGDALIQVMSGNSRGRDREILKVDVLNETLPCKKRKK